MFPLSALLSSDSTCSSTQFSFLSVRAHDISMTIHFGTSSNSSLPKKNKEYTVLGLSPIVTHFIHNVP